MPPKSKKRKSKRGASSKSKTPEVLDPSQSILMLNDDCLYIIFSYFNIREVLKLEKVCTRFKVVAEAFYRAQKELDFDEFRGEIVQFSRNEIRNIARNVGPHLTTLKLTNGFFFPNSTIIKPLFTRCNILQHLHIENFDVMDYLGVLKKTFVPLKTLKLIDCFVTDAIAPCLKVAVQLESLSLKSNEIVGGFLGDLKHLKEIDLSNCEELTKSNFLDFCKDNLSLKSLRILNWDDLDWECLQTIVTHLKNLESIGLAEIHSYSSFEVDKTDLKILADLPKLTSLELVADSLPDVPELLQSLLTRLEYLELSSDNMKDNMSTIAKFEHLKELKLHDITNGLLQILTEKLRCKNTLEVFEAHNTFLSDDDVLKFVKQCPKLKILGLSGCEDISNDLIINLVPVLNERPQKILIYVGDTKCTRSLHHELTLLGNTKIELNWKIIDPYPGSNVSNYDANDLFDSDDWYQDDADFYDSDYLDYDSDVYQGYDSDDDGGNLFGLLMAVQNIHNQFNQ